jgi:hypothetical protein
MVTPTNEPTAPPSSGKKSETRGVWLLLLVAAIVIIAGLALVSRRPGSDMGGSLSGEARSTPTPANGPP